MTRPRLDTTGVTDAPAVAHTDAVDPRDPCLFHLFELLETVRPQHRHRIMWRIPADLWERVKHDPGMKAQWARSPRAGRERHHPVPARPARRGRRPRPRPRPDHHRRRRLPTHPPPPLTLLQEAARHGRP